MEEGNKEQLGVNWEKKTTHIPLTFHILAVRMKLTQKFRTEGSEHAQESILKREKKENPFIQNSQHYNRPSYV